MSSGLSSNWKKLQAQIQAESASTPQTTTKKRKAAEGLAPRPDSGRPSKRPKAAQPRVHSFKKPNKTSKAQMGGAQSTPITGATSSSPALVQWARDNDISQEALAEAYGLGVRDNSMLDAMRDRPNDGLTKDLEVGKYIAIDCEMVGVGEGGYDHALARASVVDFHGRQVYDSFVRPKERVTDWRTSISGVSPKHMATARSFEEVQSQIAELLKDRILVGHDIKHDLHVLLLSHSPKFIRDTARFQGFKKYGNGRKPALRIVAREILGVEIQNGQHSSIEDARVAMLLFRHFKPAFDVESANRYPDSQPPPSKRKANAKKPKKKRKN